MIHFDLPKQKSSIIKVLGIGGGGSNAVNYMYAQNIEGTDFIICNTDAKALDQSGVPNKVQLARILRKGLAQVLIQKWAKVQQKKAWKRSGAFLK